MKLSIVTTMYCSSPFLDEFYRRISVEAQKLTDSYEIVFVNDGSPDDSLSIALRLQKKDARVKVIDLSRNFGHHAAIVAGLGYAGGEQVFLMDCDLEEQPEWLPHFHAEMIDSQADVVYGIQEKRVASGASNFFGALFWKALNAMSNVRIPYNPMTCRLMSREYIDALLQVEDRVLYLAGVFAWAGFSQRALSLVKVPRPTLHKSTYSLSRKLLQVADSFASFSVAPLSFIFLVGLAIWLASIGYGAYLLCMKLIMPEMIVSGFTSMMLSIWFLCGGIIVILGIIGLYVAKIFQEVKRRPLYIVRKIYTGSNHEPRP